ncbi:MAG: class I SAM-dependent methyltransferase [candidate division Zixibacteria bacterium]|nr:class I SAM-dependent methyltransferase [candidate division Zixibacteria bacterium]
MDKFLQANLDLWNELTGITSKSPSYDMPGFMAGKSTLKSIEREELGDISGKSLLHLQCHFGMDTISFARLGAKVTGVDFSDRAITLAQSLSAELKILARFICSNIYDLADKLNDQFDIVHSSYGFLCWLPDVTAWAKLVANFLKPGGFLHIVESHPFLYVFENERTTPDLRVRFSYFPSTEPTRWEPEGCYADKDAQVTHPSYEWTHSLGEIIDALIGAGLRIDYLHEFPFMVEDHFPFLQKSADGWWRLPGDQDTIPLTFSLKATKP